MGNTTNEHGQHNQQAVVMCFGIRFLHSAFLAIKRGHLKGALSSLSAFRAAMSPMLFTMEHFGFAMVFFNIASTHHMLQRVYGRLCATQRATNGSAHGEI